MHRDRRAASLLLLLAGLLTAACAASPPKPAAAPSPAQPLAAPLERCAGARASARQALAAAQACTTDLDCAPYLPGLLGCDGLRSRAAPEPAWLFDALVAACTGVPSRRLACADAAPACRAGRCEQVARPAGAVAAPPEADAPAAGLASSPKFKSLRCLGNGIWTRVDPSRPPLPRDIRATFLVGPDGRAGFFAVEPQEPPELLEVVAAAGATCQFEPGRDERGQPVASWMVVPYRLNER
jgi:hypothetical protein